MERKQNATGGGGGERKKKHNLGKGEGEKKPQLRTGSNGWAGTQGVDEGQGKGEGGTTEMVICVACTGSPQP